MQGKKIALPQYNVVATHGAAHNQQFEIECLVPKLDIQVFGTGGSRRAGEQAAAKLALEAVQAAMVKTPSAARKTKPRASQLKLAGIATIQAADAQPAPAAKSVRSSSKTDAAKSAAQEAKKDDKPEKPEKAATAQQEQGEGDTAQTQSSLNLSEGTSGMPAEEKQVKPLAVNQSKTA